MSSSLATLRFNAQVKLNDTDREKPVVQGFRWDQAISDNMQLVASRLQMPMEWLTLSALTAGTDEYVVAREYNAIALYRLAGTPELLVEKVGFERMARRRASGASTGTPTEVAVTEETPSSAGVNETRFHLWPTPDVSGTLEGLYSAVPLPLSADSDAIPMPEYALRAVEYWAAAECAAVLSAEALSKLGLSDRAVEVYQAKGEQFIEWEMVRKSRQATSRFANTSSPWG